MKRKNNEDLLANSLAEKEVVYVISLKQNNDSGDTDVAIQFVITFGNAECIITQYENCWVSVDNVIVFENTVQEFIKSINEGTVLAKHNICITDDVADRIIAVEKILEITGIDIDEDAGLIITPEDFSEVVDILRERVYLIRFY